MTFRAGLLHEPLLEFGREIDIRLGLMRHGPLEPERASRVRLGRARAHRGEIRWIGVSNYSCCSSTIPAGPDQCRR
jgi:hypothetical protein